MAKFKLENNVYTTIPESITNTSNVITVNKASDPYNTPPTLTDDLIGILTIVDNTRDPQKIEIIYYTDVVDNGDNTIDLIGVSRGQNGTSPQSFSYGSAVLQSLTTDIIDTLVDFDNYSVDDLSDIDLTGALNGYVLKYNASTETWEPSGISIDNLLDVDTTSLTADDLLSYNSTSGNWEPVTLGSQAYQDYYVSTEEPESSDGENGDVWYQIS